MAPHRFAPTPYPSPGECELLGSPTSRGRGKGVRPRAPQGSQECFFEPPARDNDGLEGFRLFGPNCKVEEDVQVRRCEPR